ncbi:uncharacterized protein C8A04DRAFT_34795 [Dichotomopilus funicola]|uniref:Uncharacterized protein n=1 Tax=Dichotomopilus funicola TaxID=1934379 RepID=A0AAN6V827_9PEZI|nr:hypothetical protein C8A04DRAFT_34795 [Dichotomopilus funicola]
MPSRKKKTKSQDQKEQSTAQLSAPTPSSETLPIPGVSTEAGTTPQPPEQVLMICRNKHWKYISSFMGSWSHIPFEVLETIANANYSAPRPRPVDPGVLFDLVKIRRLVDEATDLAVRAASGVAFLGPQNTSGVPSHMQALGLGFGHQSQPQTRLSPERKHRMREQAVHRLAEAYRIDEIIASVASMQSTSSLEEVASLVLQRNPGNADAKYVQFFHEKIPSRQVAGKTDLTILDKIIGAVTINPGLLRTRGVVRTYNEDYQNAAKDLTEALRVHLLYNPVHKSPILNQDEPSLDTAASRKHGEVKLKEEDQPTTLDIQLHFQRAGAWLNVAANYISAAFPANVPIGEAQSGSQGPSPTDEAQKKMAEARKLVRQNAKKALRDYTAFLSHFEYSPNLPIEIADEFTRKVVSAEGRTPRSHTYKRLSSSGAASKPHRVYALPELFTSSPPAGLPPYPSTEDASEAAPGAPSLALGSEPWITTEILTFHPLVPEALHSLLLCHCLIQTSTKELLRHANMVARLIRLADGYPFFQPSWCPAKIEWMRVIRTTKDWLHLSDTWHNLCKLDPLPQFYCTGEDTVPVPVPPHIAQMAQLTTDQRLGSSPAQPDQPPTSQEDTKRTASHDDRLADEPAVRMAIQARQMLAEREHHMDKTVTSMDPELMGYDLDEAQAGAHGSNTTTTIPTADSRTKPQQQEQQLRWSLTPGPGSDQPPAGVIHRANRIIQWVTQAPPPATRTGAGGGGEGGTRRRKKKKGGASATAALRKPAGSSEAQVGEGGSQGDGEGEEGQEE